jgi:hypothetical protein
VLRLASARGETIPAELRIRTLLTENPSMSVRVLARRARVSESTASKYLRLVQAENRVAAAASLDTPERQEGVAL